MLLVGLIGLTLFLTVAWFVEYYRHSNGIWRIPTPWWIPIVGHLYLAESVENAYWDLHKYTMSVGKGKIIRGMLGYNCCVNVIDPEMLQHLMVHPSVLNKSSFYKFTHRWLGTGLLTSDREKWHVRRKLLTPSYHFKILEQFIDVFDKNCNILVERLKKEVTSKQETRTNIFPYITLCALDTICETAMGTCVNAQQDSDSEYVQAIKKMSHIIISRGVSVFKQFDFIYELSSEFKEEKKCLKVLHGYTLGVIQSRRKQLIEKQEEMGTEVNDTGEKDLGYKAKVPFLDLLLQARLNGEPLSDDDIREEVDTFMFEGHDTTSAAISFCLYSLSTHPQIQKKVLEEQRAIFGADKDRMTTYQDLNEMKYLEMVIKEAMRLYPSVPFYGRVISEDFTYNDLTFKKGTEIGFFVYSLHRNPEIYPDPEVFDPERFTSEAISKRHPFAYLPFSAGSRNCVGQKFAMLEMKSTIGKLVREFIFEESEGSQLKLKSGLILSASNGVNVKIRDRVWI